MLEAINEFILDNYHVFAILTIICALAIIGYLSKNKNENTNINDKAENVDLSNVNLNELK